MNGEHQHEWDQVEAPMEHIGIPSLVCWLCRERRFVKDVDPWSVRSWAPYIYDPKRGLISNPDRRIIIRIPPRRDATV